jgi:hypothetical protein
VAKRPRFSRYRRLPPVFRSIERPLSDPADDEQRLSLYVTGRVLDRAERQAQRAGAANVQEYCAALLQKAVEAEHVREQVAEVEARRGPFEGLQAVSDDPEFLAELTAASSPRDGLEEGPDFPRASAPSPPPSLGREPDPAASASLAAQVILRHAGQAGDAPYGFLPCLRRGESVPPAELAELAQALREIEAQHQGARSLDRRLAFALHRLAFESQILHTDAWPGAFDAWTVETLRAVQEAVERILSGLDIRYSSTETEPTPEAES